MANPPTEKQIEIARRLADIVDKGPVAILEFLIAIEERISELAKAMPDYEKVLRSVRGIDGTNSKVPGPKGDDGEDYVLTEADKSEIAKKITVPVVRQIVEKREIVQKQPIFIERVEKDTVREVTIDKTDNGAEIVTKINDLAIEPELQIDFKHIKGYEDIIIRSDSSSHAVIGGPVRRKMKAYSLTSQCNSSTKVFTLPLKTMGVVGVFSTGFPVNFDAINDWSFSGHKITLGSSVPVPETGQTLWALIETL